MTVYSGIFGLVHTGIVSGIKLFGALRLQRRLDLGYGAEPVCSTGVRHHRTARLASSPVRDQPPAAL